jgi:hypothetical protein
MDRVVSLRFLSSKEPNLAAGDYWWHDRLPTMAIPLPDWASTLKQGNSPGWRESEASGRLRSCR